MTLEMNYPNGYDPTTTAALIQNPVQPLSQAPPPPAAGAFVPGVAFQQQQQPLYHPQQHPPQHHQQQQQQPPQAHRLVRPGQAQVFLGQQQFPHQQQWHSVQPPAAPPSATSSAAAGASVTSIAASLPPTSVPGVPAYHDAHSPSFQPRPHPEQRPAQHAHPLPHAHPHPHPSYNPLPPSSTAFEPSSLGVQALQQPEHLQQHQQHPRPVYGGNPAAGVPYGAPTGRMPMGGSTMYPAKQPAMTGPQNPYPGAQYARTSPNPPGMTSYTPSQPSTGPSSIHSSSPGPPSHQPYPTVTQPGPPGPALSLSGTPQPQTPAMSIPQALPPQPSQHPLQQPTPQQAPPTAVRHPHPSPVPSQQQRHMSVPGPATQTPRQSISSGGRASGSSPGSQRLPHQPPAQPPSPATMERERERVSLLLHINTELLKEAVQLQAEGKAGPTPKTEPEDDRDGVDGSKPGAPHQSFMDCMRLLQSNLAYLAAVADKAHKPTSVLPPSPAIMVAPKGIPSLAEPFRRLAALFPNPGSMDSPGKASNTGAGSPFAGHAPVSTPTPGSVAGGPIMTPDAMMADGVNRPGPPPHVRSGSMQAEQQQQYKRWLSEMSGPVQQVFEGFEQQQQQQQPQQQPPPHPHPHQHPQLQYPPQNFQQQQQQQPMGMMQPTGQPWEMQMQMNAMSTQQHPGMIPAHAYPPQASPFQQ